MGGAYRQDCQDTSETPVVAITLLSAYQKVLDQRNRIHFISPLPPLPPPPPWVSLAIRRSKYYSLQRPETPTDFDRGKLSTDPNNTAWAKSTTSFGHKMLSKQGWKPGDFLGAENASHASHYTAANASHIKVMLREENLGIGAKIGTQNAETFGLSMFSGLLGRLNGKEEDRAVMQKKEETLRDVQLKLKYGNMNFVSGGMLVGDKMQEVKTDLGHLKDGGVATVQESKKRKAGSDGSEEDEKSAKKRRKAEEKRRKAEEKEKKKKKEKKTNGTAAAIKEMKRQRKLEAGSDIPPSSKESPEQEADSSSTTSSSSEDEQESKRRKKAERKTSRSPKRTTSSSSDAKDDEKARLKEEKRARKEERRKRKEEKRAKRAAKALKSSSTIITKTTTTTQPGSTTESETQSGTSTPTFLGGRQAVRHRYIMQKRMAGASAQALQEIFMMKPQVAS